MNGIEVLQITLKSTKQMLDWYIGDLTDAELLIRPAEGANHLAWQLGHLINSEKYLITQQLPNAQYPELPAGFAETHHKSNSTKENATGFLTRADYQSLFDQVRSATIETVRSLTDSDLDRKTTGELSGFAPSLGALFLLISEHTLMHGGQFTVLRRKLGKPVLF